MRLNKRKALVRCSVCLMLVIPIFVSSFRLRQDREPQRVQFPIDNSVTAVYRRGRPVGETNSLTANTTLASRAQYGNLKERETVEVPRTAKQRGYLVVLDIPEQLTAAIEDLIQLYMFNQKHLKLGMIEPYVLGSRLKTVPPVSEDFRSLPLISTFLNKSDMLHNLEKCFNSGRVDLHPFPDFLVNAARQFIVVRFITAKRDILGGKITNCNFNMKLVEHLLNCHLEIVRDRAISKHGANYTFRGVHSLCVKAVPEEPFSMKDVAQFIRTWMTNTSNGTKDTFPPQFSVVIPEWRAVKNMENHHYYYDPSYTGRNMTGSCQLESLAHTSYVTQAAKSMFQRLSLSRPFIAVHVRSERISQPELEWHRTGFIDSCISNFSKVLQIVMKEHNISLENVVFIHDGSQYGSDSMWESRRNASNYIVSRIKAIGIRNVQYKLRENSTNINSAESALAQFVEKEFLVSADIVIMLGYGGFQHSLLLRFKSKGNDKNHWYKLCSDFSKNNHLPLNISSV